jgi:hypothetical protein
MMTVAYLFFLLFIICTISLGNDVWASPFLNVGLPVLCVFYAYVHNDAWANVPSSEQGDDQDISSIYVHLFVISHVSCPFKR